mmetsp:Transcript_74603/g.131957  ORF Transcript_74603/g.131957 Transcript_74603/m.131957 type:complete len:555 (-) Transcript_74603:132-1796(-)
MTAKKPAGGKKSAAGKVALKKGRRCSAKVQSKPKVQKCKGAVEVSSPCHRPAAVPKDVFMPIKRRRVANIHNSVIKVFVSHCQPNYHQPWCSNGQTSSTSTAFPIQLATGEKRLITNAHSVELSALIQVKRHQQEHKYVAKVLCIGPDCDLAILEVLSPEFWKGLDPLDVVQDLPDLQDSVSVVGYPTGGENLSVTQGVVSRIDLVEYAQSGTVLLGIQIDAAINSGNSGGPVVDEKGRCVGVAFQNLSGEDDGAENIGYIIPTEILMHFIEDYRRNGCFKGFGTAGFSFQSLESPVLREALGLSKGLSGVRVKAVDPSGPSHGILQTNDVVLRIDGQQIGNDGTIVFERGRIPFAYRLQKYFCDDVCEMSILRPGEDGTGKKLKVEVAVKRVRPLVNSDAGGPNGKSGSMAPRYLVAAGLIFVPLTRPFLESAYGEDWESERPGELSSEMLNLTENGVKDVTGHEPLLLTKVLASEVNIGYSDYEAEILESFNGVKVENLKHLATLLDKSKEKYLRFVFKGKDTIIVERAAATKALPGILAQNMIPSARSQVL